MKQIPENTLLAASSGQWVSIISVLRVLGQKSQGLKSQCAYKALKVT